MTHDEMIEAGARAIHRQVCRTLGLVRRGQLVDEEAAWDKRWARTLPRVQDQYRREAEAVLLAARILPAR